MSRLLRVPPWVLTLSLCVAQTAAAEIKVDVTFGDQALQPQRYFPDIIRIAATDAGKPVSGQALQVRVIRSDASLYRSDTKDPEQRQLKVTTGADGRAVLSIHSRTRTDLALDVVPLDANDQPIDNDQRLAEMNPRRTFAGSFNSTRLYTEVFTGATFTNDYDASGKNTGFHETSPLARLTFDTVWPGKPRDASATFIRRSLLHTGVDMEFSSFPFGKTGAQTPTRKQDASDTSASKGLENAFSGTVYTLWQPDSWLFSSYTPTSQATASRTDALRIGLIGKAGMTTRANAASNGDTALRRFQIGLKLTHHQTSQLSAVSDQDNIVPIRFLEISYGKFEEYAGRRHSNRLVIDGGFRLPGLGSDPIPFYAGIHLNAGGGSDDLRIFAGLLFKINEIANIFQRGAGGEQ